MIRDRLTRYFKEQALKSSTREISQFVDGLKRTGDRGLGLIVACATVVRVNMEIHGALPEGLMQRAHQASSDELGAMQMRLNRLSRQFTKRRQQGDAMGALVISYSLRCLNVPELLPLGREMWAELRRGYPHVEEALREGEKRNGKPFDPRVREEWRTIPPGLTPLE
jgi:hypothetical protein